MNRPPWLRQLWWIGVSYLTRPACLALLGVGVLMYAMNSSRHDSSIQNLMSAIIPCESFAVAIGIQLSSQFLGNGSRLIPGFVTSHTLVAVTLSLGIISLAAARLSQAGITPLAAIAFSALAVTGLIYWASILAYMKACQTRLQGKQRILHVWLFVVMSLFLLQFTNVAGEPREIINSSLAIAANALVACATTGLTSWTLWQLPLWSTGSAGLERRSSLQPEWAQSNWVARKTGATNKREGKIEEWLPTCNSSVWWQSVFRWRLGNPPLRQVRITVLMFFVFTAQQVLISFYMNQWFSISGTILIMTSSFLPLSSSQIGGMWRGRLPILALEWTRPISLHVLRRELALALLLDLFPIAILFSLAQSIAINLDTTLHVTWGNVPVSFLVVFMLGYCVATAVAAMVIVVRRLWISLVLLTGLALANIFGVVKLTSMQIKPQHSLDLLFKFPQAVQWNLWLPTLVGAIVCLVLWRMWLRLEIGRRA